METGSQIKKPGKGRRNALLIVVLLIGLAVVAGIYSLNQDRMRSYAVDKTLDGAQVQSLRIDSHDANLHLHPGSDQQMAVHLSGDAPDGYQLVSDVQDNQLHVEVVPPHFSLRLLSFYWYRQTLQLDVTVPQKVYDQLNLTATSGDVSLEDLQAQQDTLSVSSGNLSAQAVKAQSLAVTSHSGNVQLADVQADATVQASSGDIRIENLKGAHHDVSASSGNLQLEQVSGDVQAKTSSGNIELVMSTASNNVDASATSGNVQVYLPANANFRTDLSVSSGDMQADFPVQWTVEDQHHKSGSVGTGGPLVKLQASSGNVELLKQ